MTFIVGVCYNEARWRVVTSYNEARYRVVTSYNITNYAKEHEV